MAHQATVNGGLRFRSRREGIFESIGELSGDVASLAELQLQLTAIDTKEAVGRATWPTIVLVASGAILMAALPLLLMGLAFVLAAAVGISHGVSLLITGTVVAVAAAAVGFLAIRELRHSFESFRRSREEFTRNVNWIRTVLTQSGKTVHRS